MQQLIVLFYAASLCAMSSSLSCAWTPRPRENAPIRLVHESLAGSWQDEADPEFILSLEGAQLLMADSGRIFNASTVLRSIEKGILVCDNGHEVELSIRRDDDHIELFDARGGRARRLVKLDSRPAVLSLLLPLSGSVSLPEERILEIQGEVRRRYQADQSMLRQRVRGQEEPPPWLESSSKDLPPGRSEDGINFLAIDRYGTNAEFMRDLVQEIGWVDARRFGYPASLNAFFLVQHGRDLPLMLSVLPRIKEDVDAGLMDGESYALLYDRAQLALGRLQRFGSQVARAPSGEVIVLPLESPERVDDRRKEWGLRPLKDYVGIFGASDVKVSPECSALSR